MPVAASAADLKFLHHLQKNSVRNFKSKSGARIIELLEHDPEKWGPVFGKDHALTSWRIMRIDGVYSHSASGVGLSHTQAG